MEVLDYIGLAKYDELLKRYISGEISKFEHRSDYIKNSDISYTGTTIRIGNITADLGRVTQFLTSSSTWSKVLFTYNSALSSGGTIISGTCALTLFNTTIECLPSTGTLKATNLQATSAISAGTTVTAGSAISAGTTVTAATSITSTVGDFYVGGTSGSRCHLKMDTTNKCLKFVFD